MPEAPSRQEQAEQAPCQEGQAHQGTRLVELLAVPLIQELIVRGLWQHPRPVFRFASRQSSGSPSMKELGAELGFRATSKQCSQMFDAAVQELIVELGAGSNMAAQAAAKSRMRPSVLDVTLPCVVTEEEEARQLAGESDEDIWMDQPPIETVCVQQGQLLGELQEGVSDWGPLCSQVQELCLRQGVGDTALGKFLSARLPRLTSLSLIHPMVMDRLSAWLPATLTHLTLDRARFCSPGTPRGLDCLVGLRSLSLLELTTRMFEYEEVVDPHGVQTDFPDAFQVQTCELARLTGLTRLVLACTRSRLSGKRLSALTALTALNHLEVAGGYWVSAGEDLIKCLPAWAGTLQTLALDFTNAWAEGVGAGINKALRQLTRLTHLQCGHLSDRPLHLPLLKWWTAGRHYPSEGATHARHPVATLAALDFPSLTAITSGWDGQLGRQDEACVVVVLDATVPGDLVALGVAAEGVLRGATRVEVVHQPAGAAGGAGGNGGQEDTGESESGGDVGHADDEVMGNEEAALAVVDALRPWCQWMAQLAEAGGSSRSGSGSAGHGSSSAGSYNSSAGGSSIDRTGSSGSSVTIVASSSTSGTSAAISGRSGRRSARTSYDRGGGGTGSSLGRTSYDHGGTGSSLGRTSCDHAGSTRCSDNGSSSSSGSDLGDGPSHGGWQHMVPGVPDGVCLPRPRLTLKHLTLTRAVAEKLPQCLRGRGSEMGRLLGPRPDAAITEHLMG